MGRLSQRMGDSATASSQRRWHQARRSWAAKIESKYAGSMYAFSYNGNGKLDKTATIYPTVAWWDGHYALQQPDAMFSRWASHEFSTDWGLRDLGEHEALYDPTSYHQGSVWPLFTGWTSVAEYRTGRSLSGYAHLMQNADLTWAQDLGAVTELLSGAYFAPMGRSTSHQMWSSAMVITPAVRGLFGIGFEANASQLTVDPHLPAEWNEATLHNLAIGNQRATLTMKREGGTLIVSVSKSSQIKLRQAGRAEAGVAELRIPLPEVEVGMPTGLPLPGAATAQLKVLSESHEARSMSLQLEAQGGSAYDLPLRLNRAAGKSAAEPHVEGATILPSTTDPAMRTLHVVFPAGAGYQPATVKLSW